MPEGEKEKLVTSEPTTPVPTGTPGPTGIPGPTGCTKEEAERGKKVPVKPPASGMPKGLKYGLLAGCGCLSAVFLACVVGFGYFVYWETYTEEGKKFAAKCAEERKVENEKWVKQQEERRVAKAQRDKEEAQRWVQEQNLKRMERKYGKPSPEEIARQFVIPDE